MRADGIKHDFCLAHFPEPLIRAEILSLIIEHANRYFTGSQGRIALEALALEIKERS